MTHEVSTHQWDQVSTARCHYYCNEAQYMTHEAIHISETKYLMLDVSTTTLRPRIWHMRSVHISETKYLLQDVITTAMRPSIWHMRQEHISETKYLMLDVRTTTLRPSIWHEVSPHQWDQVSSAWHQYYYLEAQYMTHKVRTHQWDQVSTARCQYYYLDATTVFDTYGQYTSVRPSIYC